MFSRSEVMGFGALPLAVASPSPAQGALPQVEFIDRTGPVLQAGPNPDLLYLKSVSLTDGCAQGCAFCFAGGQNYRAGGIGLLRNTAESLARELRSRRPKAVYMSPASDPFPPLVEVQREAARVVEVLVAHGVDVWLMTRGYIRPSALRILSACRDRIRITIPLITLERGLQRLLEPWTAPPSLRLRQIEQLRRLGLRVQVSLEPLVPGLTDTKANIQNVLEALARIEVNQVQVGYLVLRPGMQDHLLEALEPHGWAESVLDAFTGGPVMATAASRSVRYLPKRLRQRGYAAIMALAAELGISVRVNGDTNRDFYPSCRPQRITTSWRQPLLPAFTRSAS
jgi:DNA repair photolyase